ncbi:hypothetical protein IAR50_007454 [Cryptococcus sp. DSM 104548]
MDEDMSKRSNESGTREEEQERRIPSARSLESEEGRRRVSREPDIVRMSSSPTSPKAIVGPVETRGSASARAQEPPKPPKPSPRLPLLFRSSPPPVAPLITDTMRSPSSPHDHLPRGPDCSRYSASPRSPFGPSGRPTRRYHHPPSYSSSYTRDYPRSALYPHPSPPPHVAHAYSPYSPSSNGYPHRHHSSLPPIHTRLPAEYYPTPVSSDSLYHPGPLAPRYPHHRIHPHAYEGYYPPYSPPSPPSYMYPRKEAAYRSPPADSSRLGHHPYAPPPGWGHPEDGMGYYAAGAVAPEGRMRVVGGPSVVGRERRSPASAIVPGRTASGPNFRSPRKRADDVQLQILSEVFQRTAYPSTEERDELARQLGMTSRSVQIWFQNRRRAVKVDQQSAAQRAEAEYRDAMYSEHKKPMPARFGVPSEGAVGTKGEVGEDAGVKRERVSP